MSINLKQPKYILPLILLPFLCLFFFVYHSGFAAKKTEDKPVNGINTSVGQVSGDVQKKQLDDKLDAYRNTYKEGDGMTAVNALPAEKTTNPAFQSSYSDKEKKMLDSINEAMKAKYGQGAVSPPKRKTGDNDQAMIQALNGLKNRHPARNNPGSADQQVKDPMETFRQQMAYLDSMNKANDPAIKAERQKSEALAKVAAQKANEPKLAVRLADAPSTAFNTVLPVKHPDFIKVVIDENLTGYAGSRIRLRLLDDIDAGSYRIPKGTYLYALITGFSGQRVELTVKSILYENKILPVKLQVYDLDGLSGLYVPESAFRDFTKDLGTNTVQGVTIDGGGTGSVASQFAMSTASKMFESTSSAIAGLIHKDKAKIKYNSYLYLIDNEALEKAQQHY
ncbi:Bacteroides conjugative transposon TraM protein [Mucilaginibacter pineti]|uniref:Bacteroides conjugative transposon TraM protein n=1 Tax=Mucilaginibacter pineti TaxID=1391627 RepID=A0A1G7G7X4_9SPHI|nr:conjugative transposon protein TraM [Mucilaginibacter pineti]SDE84197.1 Bacteroides conjugative transposon TraM protein [Mucilaginibacter pineti]